MTKDKYVENFWLFNKPETYVLEFATNHYFFVRNKNKCMKESGKPEISRKIADGRKQHKCR